MTENNSGSQEYKNPLSDPIRPAHYGGETNPFEPIKIIEHYSLNFSLGNAIKYLLRAGKKDSYEQDLRKAIQYIEFEIKRNEKPQEFAKGGVVNNSTYTALRCGDPEEEVIRVRSKATNKVEIEDKTVNFGWVDAYLWKAKYEACSKILKKVVYSHKNKKGRKKALEEADLFLKGILHF